MRRRPLTSTRAREYTLNPKPQTLNSNIYLNFGLRSSPLEPSSPSKSLQNRCISAYRFKNQRKQMRFLARRVPNQYKTIAFHYVGQNLIFFWPQFCHDFQTKLSCEKSFFWAVSGGTPLGSLFFSSCFFIFYHFFTYLHVLSFSFIFIHFLSCSCIFFHVLSCSFIYFHCLSFSFIFFHSLSFSFIFFHSLSFSFIFFHSLSFSIISFIFSHFLSFSASLTLNPEPCTLNPKH